MTRPMEVEDIARLRSVCDPQISPDGSRVAYVVTRMLVEEKRYQSRIWLVDASGNREPVELTRGDGKDTSPRWSPDGKSLAFLTDRWEKNQIALMGVEGGEAEQITDLSEGVQEFDWTSSGQGFLFVAKADYDQTLKHQSDVEKPDDAADQSNEPRRITTLAHRIDGVGFKDDKRTHVGVALRSGRIIQMTKGDFDHAQPALSPCRRYLAFASNRSDNADNERRTDIWLMDLDTDTTRRITNHNGVYGLPAFSPDSSRLAFVGHPAQAPYGPTALDRLWVAGVDSGRLDLLTGDVDREMTNTCSGDSSYGVPTQRPVWSAVGQAVYSLMSDRGNVGVVRVEANGELTHLISGNRETMNFSVSEDGHIAFTSSDPIHPAEVHILDTGSQTERQLTTHNAGLLESITLSAPVHIPYSAKDGTQLDAWLLRPAGFKTGVKYPLVLEIHGGPHAMYGNTFFHEFQLLAACGYGVLYTNPRGSTGYGQDFLSAAMGDWGGIDYQDIMAGLDTVCAQFDWIDSSRLGMTGGSYGGYMVNWMLTQTDLFAAAITQRSTCNRYNLFGSSDLVWTYSEWEFRGLPWEETDLYYDRSPISYVDQVSTPVLIMHSENDMRCPVEQGEQWFTALKRLGKAAEFVRFPGESHNLSRSGRPDHRQERFRWMLSWFARHL